MHVSITFRHMEASDAIRDHIDQQIGHLEKYLIKPTEVHVVLSVEKKFQQRCEVVLQEQHFRASADVVTEDMYKSIDKAVSKIQHQVTKYKSKVQDHHKESLHVVAAQAESNYQKATDED